MYVLLGSDRFNLTQTITFDHGTFKKKKLHHRKAYNETDSVIVLTLKVGLPLYSGIQNDSATLGGCSTARMNAILHVCRVRCLQAHFW